MDFNDQRRKHQTSLSQPAMTSNVRKRRREKLKASKNKGIQREECRHKQQETMLTSVEPDVVPQCKNGGDTAPVVVKAEEIDPSESDKWKEQDALCSDDDFDANDVLDLFPSLPSPPREIMESLNEDTLFPNGNMVYDTNSKDYPDSPAVPGILVDSFPSSPSPSASVCSWDKKKKTSISFGNVNETTSIHGRTRKMTERAVELLQNHKDRGKLKRKVDVVEAEVAERWCFCREGSSGSMICCDDPECKYQWFHFECVGLIVEPKGQWFCSECSGKRR